MTPASAQTVPPAGVAHRRLLAVRAIRRIRGLSLTVQFVLVCLAVLVGGGLVVGRWVGDRAAARVLDRSAAMTGLYVDSVLAEYLQPLVSHTSLDEMQLGTLDGLLTATPLGSQIVAFKVWSPDGEILYSPNRVLVGRRFAVDEHLARSVGGEVTVGVSDLRDPENEYERARWSRLMEVYVPVREHGTGRIIAVTEFYQLPDALDRDVRTARIQSWGVVAGVMLTMFVLLVGIVRRGSKTIADQQRALRETVTTQAALLEQNARLHERIRQAAGRTTTLNEQALRRISADLHDGPAQALAFALLRLDAVVEEDARAAQRSDCAAVRIAVQDALKEIRAISAGLRSPELAGLPLSEIARRAVQDHERRSGSRVQVRLDHLPEAAPLAIKIALFRTLQEALSNAARHGGGAQVAARLWIDAGRLHLEITDRGPGLSAAGRNGSGLGLAGMRERAELLGGEFAISSTPGEGTHVVVWWPMDQLDEA